MVTKVVTANDVDNVTIVINGENKLQAKLPATTPSEVVIKEVTGITNYNDAFGTPSVAPFGITKGGQHYPITKVGRIVGTNWLVFQADNLFSPGTTPPASKPTIEKNITIEFYDDVITGDSVQQFYEHAGKVRVIVEDGSEFVVTTANTAWQGAIHLDYQGDNGSVSDAPFINFVDKTYQVQAYYRDIQTTSTLQSASGTDSFVVETVNAVYKYTITAVSVVQNTPAEPEPLPILPDLYVECGEIVDAGDHYEVNHPPVVRITSNDLQGKIPQSVMFNVTVGNETRTYSYHYSASNEYVWDNIADFSYGKAMSVDFSAAVFVFAGGQSTPAREFYRCAFSIGRD